MSHLDITYCWADDFSLDTIEDQIAALGEEIDEIRQMTGLPTTATTTTTPRRPSSGALHHERAERVAFVNALRGDAVIEVEASEDSGVDLSRDRRHIRAGSKGKGEDVRSRKDAGMESAPETRPEACRICEAPFLQEPGTNALAPGCTNCGLNDFCRSCVRNVKLVSRGETNRRIICLRCIDNLRGSCARCGEEIQFEGKHSLAPPCTECGERLVCCACVANVRLVSRGEQNRRIICKSCVEILKSSTPLSKAPVVVRPSPPSGHPPNPPQAETDSPLPMEVGGVTLRDVLSSKEEGEVVPRDLTLSSALHAEEHLTSSTGALIEAARKGKETAPLALPNDARAMKISDLIRVTEIHSATEEGIFLAHHFSELLKEGVVEHVTWGPNMVQAVAFLACLCDFQKLDIELALRLCVQKLGSLPGDGQKKTRLIEAFSQVYYHDNSSGKWFDSPESACFLASGMFMLQTTFHNQNVRKEYVLTMDQWLEMNAGHNGSGKDFDHGMLLSIFENIRDSEITYQEDAGQMVIRKQGWMTVRMGGRFSFLSHSSWVVISLSSLSVFDSARKKVCKCSIPLNKETELIQDDETRTVSLQVRGVGRASRKSLEVSLTAASAWAYTTWLSALSDYDCVRTK